MHSIETLRRVHRLMVAQGNKLMYLVQSIHRSNFLQQAGVERSCVTGPGGAASGAGRGRPNMRAVFVWQKLAECCMTVSHNTRVGSQGLAHRARGGRRLA